MAEKHCDVCLVAGFKLPTLAPVVAESDQSRWGRPALTAPSASLTWRDDSMRTRQCERDVEQHGLEGLVGRGVLPASGGASEIVSQRAKQLLALSAVSRRC